MLFRLRIPHRGGVGIPISGAPPTGGLGSGAQIAMVIAQGGDIFPPVAARRSDHLAEALGACKVQLTPEDRVAIEQAVPSAPRPPSATLPPGWPRLDSERR